MIEAEQVAESTQAIGLWQQSRAPVTAPGGLMTFDESTEQNVLIVRPKLNRIDAAIAGEFRQTLAEVAQRGRTPLVLDLSQVAFMDSSGLGAIVSGLKPITQKNAFAIAGVGEPIVTLFKITRMDKVFRLYPSVADAIAALAA